MGGGSSKPFCIDEFETYNNLNCVVSFYPEEPNVFGVITLEMLQPQICWKQEPSGRWCNVNQSINPSPSILEMGIYVEFFMISFLSLMLAVNCRSCSKITTDWFRIIAIYIAATMITFVFFSILGPLNTLGATKQILVGVIAHNATELYFISQIFNGSIKSAPLNATYWTIFISWAFFFAIVVTFIPLNTALFIIYLQGFTLDWTLMIAFAYTAYKLKAKNNKYRALNWCFAASGIVVHLILDFSFSGFQASALIIFVVGGLLVIPWFMLLTIFAMREQKRNVLFSNSYDTESLLIYKITTQIQAFQKKDDGQNQLGILDGPFGHVPRFQEFNEKPNQDEEIALQYKRATYTLFSEGMIKYLGLPPTKTKAIIISLGFIFGFAETWLTWMAACILPPSLMCTNY